jgi:hypothetical protein
MDIRGLQQICMISPVEISGPLEKKASGGTTTNNEKDGVNHLRPVGEQATRKGNQNGLCTRHDTDGSDRHFSDRSCEITQFAHAEIATAQRAQHPVGYVGMTSSSGTSNLIRRQ